MGRQRNQLTAFLLLWLGSILAGEKANLRMTVEVRNGTGDDPMIVAWLEDKNGTFIQTLHMFSKDKKYYKDMNIWFDKRKKQGESLKQVDAVSGATIKWRQSKSAEIQFDIPEDTGAGYVIRIESRKDKGGHYKSLSIPLAEALQGGTFEHNGYAKKITIEALKDNK